MRLYDLQQKIPELETSIVAYLTEKNIPYKVPFFGDSTIDDADAERAIRIFYEELELKKMLASLSPEQRQEWEQRNQEQKLEHIRQEQEEEAHKKRAMAQMLITSGFNFDGYRIVKYSGYISGDDAMSVDRGYAWENVTVRDKLMASLTQIRRNALRELKEAAYYLGCNAVIGVDFDYITLDPQTANLTGGTTYQPYVFCVTANGNAVIIEKIED